MPVRIDLHAAQFGEKERPVCQAGELSVSALRFESGVAALRIRNGRGEIVMLPFQGQQVWRAAFDGRDLTMRSMFEEPRDTSVYLETYGAFLIHCGLAGLGAPGPADTHPLHGELPNAPFQTAWLEIDESAGTVTSAGSYNHTVAFSTNYLATVATTLAAGSAILDVSIGVENLKRTPMELMYLAHANFRPVDNGALHYTAEYDANSVRVRRSIPSHVTPFRDTPTVRPTTCVIGRTSVPWRPAGFAALRTRRALAWLSPPPPVSRGTTSRGRKAAS